MLEGRLGRVGGLVWVGVVAAPVVLDDIRATLVHGHLNKIR